VSGPNLRRSNRGESAGLRLQSVVMADVSWRRSGIGIWS